MVSPGRGMVIYAATGNLGYGFPETSLAEALKHNPRFLGCDAGSTDPGPYYLGSGKAFVSREACKRDAALLLRAARKNNIPLIIGSAGGTGSERGLSWLRGIIEEIALEQDLHFRMACIHAEQDKSYLRKLLAEGKIDALESFPSLDEITINRADHIVGVMGVEPIQKALKQRAEVIIAGRCTDTSVYAAIPLMEGFEPGVVWHAAKTIECGAAMAVPKTSDSMLAYLYDDHFVLEAPNPQKRVRKLNVAAHTMYENASPYYIREPGGLIDTSEASYEQMDERKVRVSGSRFLPQPYTVKLEGAEKVGYRCICIGGIRDNNLIQQIDQYLERVRYQLGEKVSATFGNAVSENSYSCTFHVYGKNAVMGQIEPVKDVCSHELGILIDVVASTQAIASSVCAFARTLTLHGDFVGRLCNAGNVAFPFSPSDLEVGPVYRFCLNHVARPDNPYEMFPIEMIEV